MNIICEIYANPSIDLSANVERTLLYIDDVISLYNNTLLIISYVIFWAKQCCFISFYTPAICKRYNVLLIKIDMLDFLSIYSYI